MPAYPSTTTSLLAVSARQRTVGTAQPFTIQKTFDLDTLLTAKIANADIVNLFTLPAGHVVLATRIKTTVISVGGSSTCTAKLRFGTTDVGAATDILSTAVGTGGATTTALPLSVGTADVLVNLVFAIGGGTTTVNPTIQVTLLVCDMAAE